MSSPYSCSHLTTLATAGTPPAFRRRPIVVSIGRLNKDQLGKHGNGREFQLHGPNANVRLRLDDVRRKLFKIEPELLADLAEIAVYVFAADCAIPRGGPMLAHMGKEWRRAFRIVIAVRKPGVWREPARLSALCETLQFLSEDTWHFDFVELINPPSIQDYLVVRDPDAESSGDSSIVLFSGGLDSLAGAVHELTTNRHVVLLSRRTGGLTDRVQRELAAELKNRYPARITHVPVNVGLKKETAAVEHTQRTRSFMFAAIAMVAAAIEVSVRRQRL